MYTRGLLHNQHLIKFTIWIDDLLQLHFLFHYYYFTLREHSNKKIQKTNTLQRHLKEVVRVFVHEGFGLGQGREGPAVVQVSLMDSSVEVVVDEVGRCGHAQVPAERLQQQQLHLDEVTLVEGEVQTTHEAQSVQLLQFGHTVLLLLELTWAKTNKYLSLSISFVWFQLQF